MVQQGLQAVQDKLPTLQQDLQSVQQRLPLMQKKVSETTQTAAEADYRSQILSQQVHVADVAAVEAASTMDSKIDAKLAAWAQQHPVLDPVQEI